MSAAVLSIPLLKELHTESRPERRFEFSLLSLCCCWPLFSCIGPTLKEPFNVMSCKWFGHRSLHAATEHNAHQYDLIETTPQSSQGLVLRHISDNEMISRTEDSLFNVQEGVKVPFLDSFQETRRESTGFIFENSSVWFEFERNKLQTPCCSVEIRPAEMQLSLALSVVLEHRVSVTVSM